MGIRTSYDESTATLFVCHSTGLSKRPLLFYWSRVLPLQLQPMPKLEEESDLIRMKRIEVHDPVALREEGRRHYIEGDYKSAFVYWTKAAELGDIVAHYNLSVMYRKGKGVEKDEK